MLFVLWQPPATPPSLSFTSFLCWSLGSHDSVGAKVGEDRGRCGSRCGSRRALRVDTSVRSIITCHIVVPMSETICWSQPVRTCRIIPHLLCKDQTWHLSESDCGLSPRWSLAPRQLAVKPKWCLHLFIYAGYIRVQITGEFDIQKHIYPHTDADTLICFLIWVLISSLLLHGQVPPPSLAVTKRLDLGCSCLQRWMLLDAKNNWNNKNRDKGGQRR